MASNRLRRKRKRIRRKKKIQIREQQVSLPKTFGLGSSLLDPRNSLADILDSNAKIE